jgi:23S rRNA (adenine2503-C2)-methyltransferase
MGFVRDLTTAEILDQIIKMKRSLNESGENITNIVFMGMGDPLDNIEAVAKAITILTMETAFGIGQRKITVSTCGLIPGMKRLPEIYKHIGLAISLNAPDDNLRNRLMPVNRKYPLGKLMEAVREFTKITRRRVTFEYILIDGVNDSPEHARKLLALARSVPSKINLIAFNEFEGSPFRRPSDEKIEVFQRILFEGNVTVMLRKSKGTDILAACGQLASKKKDNPAR